MSSGSATTSRSSAGAWSACSSARSWKISVRCSTASSTTTPGYLNRAIEAKVDPLGYYLAPFGYASGQMLEQAVKAVGSLDQKALAKYLRENEHKTIVGPIAFSADGERKETATLQAQFRSVVDKNIEQFRKPGTQVILFPAKLKSGELVSPFEAARK